MASYLLLSLAFPLASIVVWNLSKLAANYAVARKVGVPLIVLPISPENPTWWLVSDFCIPIIKRIPFGSGTFTRYCHRGWEFFDRNRTHLELGDVFMIVTPRKNILYVCNAEALAEVIERRNEFQRPLEVLHMLTLFGPNISTVEGKDWQRHRKMIGSLFSEQVNRCVWAESLRQVRDMLHYWMTQAPIAVRSTANDTKTFSLHVLTAVEFGKSFSFQSSIEGAETGRMLSYRDSLSVVLEHVILIMIVGSRFLTAPFLPKRWIRVGQATVDFQQYMADMLEQEKHRIVRGASGSGNFLTALVRASRAVAEPVASSGGSKGACTARTSQVGLTDAEIFGNLFVLNFAGHDTSARSLAYCLTLLAVHPEVQDWIGEEIRYVLSESDSSGWNYEASFPRLKRCLAILFETLRLYFPVIAVLRSTGADARTLAIAGKPLLIPANTLVIPSIMAIHSHPRYWGADALVWRPSRWIIEVPASGKEEGGVTFDRETLYTPPKGTYLPWSDGSRGCPGKKFAQVETVGALAGLFRDHKVEPVPEDGENMEMARKRTMDVVEDSKMMLLLQMLKPERAGLRWVKR